MDVNSNEMLEYAMKIKNKKCPLCDEEAIEFFDSMELNYHIYKLYRCKECNKRYTLKYYKGLLQKIQKW